MQPHNPTSSPGERISRRRVTVFGYTMHRYCTSRTRKVERVFGRGVDYTDGCSLGAGNLRDTNHMYLTVVLKAIMVY